ncbi:hypothetical protein N7507_010767 [Penicillium longicatenatum]|nr:hypothetical protein N7507_010767 [Penicillium longicatenatum]
MDEVHATAKWANRVLRPLTSIYRRLEKHQETLAIIAAESRAQEHDKEIQSQYSEEVTSARENYCESDADEDDPGWIPGKKPDQRRVKYKYSTRGGNKTGRRRTRFTAQSPEATRTLPGAIDLATPLITGRRWELPSSVRSQLSVKQHQTTQSRRGDVQALRGRHSLQKDPWQEVLSQCGDAGFTDIVRNLDHVLQMFFRKTRVINYCPSSQTNEPEQGARSLSSMTISCPAVKLNEPKQNARSQSSIIIPRPAVMLSEPERGARSLLSMVTRRLPDYIAIEQEAQDERDDEEDEDMCDVYFTELESFYAPHGKGWKPLREAVRAQGIRLVSEMIRNQWLTDPVTYALLDKLRCYEQDAVESLLSAFLSTCTTGTLPVTLRPVAKDSPTISVRLLYKYVHKGPYRPSYVYDELSKLVARGGLPPEWIATPPWTGCMTQATVSFSKDDCYSAVSARLIEAVLLSACVFRNENLQVRPQQRPTSDHVDRSRTTRTSRVPISSPGINRKCPVHVEDALSNHVTSLLATLCGMHISRSRKLDDFKDTNGTKAGHLITSVCFTVKNYMETEQLSHICRLPSHQLLRRGCILLADCLLQCNNAVLADKTEPFLISTATIEEYSNVLVPRSSLIKEMALFVRQAFRCFSSSSSNEDTDMRSEIRRIVSRLPYLTKAPGLSMLLSRVAVEAAMEFAEGTGDPDDHLWAVEIQETTVPHQPRAYSSSGSASETEGPGPSRGLFRWEDGIGEWVARTPAVKVNATTAVSKRRASAIFNTTPRIRGSTDISSPQSECFESLNPGLTSSPSSVGTKRQSDALESSPTRPFKRRRGSPPVVINQTLPSGSESLSDRSPSRSPSLEPLPSRRRVLRDMSTHIIANSTRSVPHRPASNLEVVIINKKQPLPAARPASEHVEKQVHRSTTRARPGRPSLSRAPRPIIVPRRQSVIPCSQDDSDDELSFI